MFTIVYLASFFKEPATAEIYTLSLHDALPIYRLPMLRGSRKPNPCTFEQMFAFCRRAVLGSRRSRRGGTANGGTTERSEEHTSELQSQSNLVCRLLLEKKK